MCPCHAAALPVAQTVGSAMAKAHPRMGHAVDGNWLSALVSRPARRPWAATLSRDKSNGGLRCRVRVFLNRRQRPFYLVKQAVLPCETGRMAMQYRPFGSVIRPVFPTVCGTVGWARRCNCRQPFPRPNARLCGLMPLASLWRWHQGRNTVPVRPCGHRHLFIIYRQLPTTACIHLP